MKILSKPALQISAIFAFLCLFDVQLQTLVTFEGINNFLFLKKGIKALSLKFKFLF